MPGNCPRVTWRGEKSISFHILIEKVYGRSYSIEICYSTLLNEICIDQRRRKEKCIPFKHCNSLPEIEAYVIKQIFLKNRLSIRISACLGVSYFKSANCCVIIGQETHIKDIGKLSNNKPTIEFYLNYLYLH